MVFGIWYFGYGVLVILKELGELINAEEAIAEVIGSTNGGVTVIPECVRAKLFAGESGPYAVQGTDITNIASEPAFRNGRRFGAGGPVG